MASHHRNGWLSTMISYPFNVELARVGNIEFEIVRTHKDDQ